VAELEMPRNLVEAARAELRDDWLAGLAEKVAELASRWSLTLDAPYQPGGQTAWVAPVRSAAFGAVMGR
jgi:streptomycin 6-kinase